MSMVKLLNQVDEILRSAQNLNPKRKQIAKITKLYKYIFKWKRRDIFLYICRTFPGLREQIPDKLQNTYNLSALYAAMDKTQLSKVIKRLEAIERRNLKKIKTERMQK